MDQYDRRTDKCSNILTCSAPLWIQVGAAVVSFFTECSSSYRWHATQQFFFPWERPAGFYKQVLTGMKQQLRKHVSKILNLCRVSSFYRFSVNSLSVHITCSIYLQQRIYDMMVMYLSCSVHTFRGTGCENKQDLFFHAHKESLTLSIRLLHLKRNKNAIN